MDYLTHTFMNRMFIWCHYKEIRTWQKESRITNIS